MSRSALFRLGRPLLAATALLGLASVSAGQGIASRYPGDVGIENDPAVVFTANFERASVADVAARWDDRVNEAGMSLTADTPSASEGSLSLEVTSTNGINTGGHLYKSFPAGFDQLYARFYVKLGAACSPVHHFVHMGGYNPPTPWPQGGAGVRPDGTERFTTGIEPMGADWRWDFYTYWMHMRGNPGPNYWGNTFNPTPVVAVPCDRWIAVELMMQVNDPVTSFNGEQSFWIDGAPAHSLGEGFPRGDWVWDHFHPDAAGAPFEGFQWRVDPALRINFFWLLYYMTQGSPGQVDSVRFDDVVIATSYIGPITPLVSAQPVLCATRAGADVALEWTDTGAANYTLIRSENPDLSGATTLFDGAALTASDPAAIPAAATYYYRVE